MRKLFKLLFIQTFDFRCCEEVHRGPEHMSPVLCEGQVRPVRQQGTDVQSLGQERSGMITIYTLHIKHMLLY